MRTPSLGRYLLSTAKESGCGTGMLVQKLEAALLPRGDRVAIGPLHILQLDRAQAIDLIRSAVLLRKKTNIAICNAHTVLTALDDPSYARVLQSMTLFNDGIGLNLASRYLHGASFPENLNGTDFVPEMLSNIGVPLRIYLLGAKETQLELARRHIEAHHPLHTVVGTRNGYFRQEDAKAVCEDISAASPDLLLVAMGNPRQEHFLYENRHQLNATIGIGVGALFDFMSGTVVRAPSAVRAIGLEWLFRMLQEPRRLCHRYLIGIPRFLLALRRLKKDL